MRIRYRGERMALRITNDYFQMIFVHDMLNVDFFFARRQAGRGARRHYAYTKKKISPYTRNIFNLFLDRNSLLPSS